MTLASDESDSSAQCFRSYLSVLSMLFLGTDFELLVVLASLGVVE